jgi:hypothetical protein
MEQSCPLMRLNFGGRVGVSRPHSLNHVVWDVIISDVMSVMELFSNLHYENFHWLNSANNALLPKKDVAESISDYGPISFIHSISKIIAKKMVTWLGPFMNDIILPCQSD